jgi:hypothetical protein
MFREGIGILWRLVTKVIGEENWVTIVSDCGFQARDTEPRRCLINSKNLLYYISFALGVTKITSKAGNI